MPPLWQCTLLHHPTVIVSNLHEPSDFFPHATQRTALRCLRNHLNLRTSSVQRSVEIQEPRSDMHCQSLHTETNSKNRNALSQGFGSDVHQLVVLVGQTWPGRKNQCIGLIPIVFTPHSFLNHMNHPAMALQIMGEVPCEGIVVVEKGDAHQT